MRLGPKISFVEFAFQLARQRGFRLSYTLWRTGIVKCILALGSFTLQGLDSGSLVVSSLSKVFSHETRVSRYKTIGKAPFSIKIRHTLYVNFPCLQNENSVNCSSCL